MPSLVTNALSDAVLAAMREATDAEVMPRWRSLTADEVRTKAGPWDLVTDADVLAERRLTASLGALLDIPVVGEEATAADPALAGYRWRRRGVLARGPRGRHPQLCARS